MHWTILSFYTINFILSCTSLLSLANSTFIIFFHQGLKAIFKTILNFTRYKHEAACVAPICLLTSQGAIICNLFVAFVQKIFIVHWLLIRACWSNFKSFIILCYRLMNEILCPHTEHITENLHIVSGIITTVLPYMF